MHKSLTTILIFIAACLNLSIMAVGQDKKWANNPLTQSHILRMPDERTAIWLTQYQIGIVPAVDTIPTSTPIKSFPTLVLYQRWLSQDTYDSEQDSSPKSNKKDGFYERTFQDPVSQQLVISYEKMITDVEWRGFLDTDKQLEVFYSPTLAHFSEPSFRLSWNEIDQPRAIGYAHKTEHHQPESYKAFHWYKAYPFWQQTMDTLQANHPTLSPQDIYAYDHNEELSKVLIQNWPFQRSQILIDALTDQGHPVFAMVKGLYLQHERLHKTGKLPTKNQIQKVVQQATDLEKTNDIQSLEKQFSYFFYHIHGPLLSPWLVQQAKRYNKDYNTLVQSLLLKSMLFSPNIWVNRYQSNPEDMLNRIEKDYGYQLIKHILITTRQQLNKQYLTKRTNQQELLQKYARQQVYDAPTPITGALFQVPLDYDQQSLAIRSNNFIPGMHGAFIIGAQQAATGILLQCQADGEAGRWEANRTPVCSLIFPWANIISLLDRAYPIE